MPTPIELTQTAPFPTGPNPLPSSPRKLPLDPGRPLAEQLTAHNPSDDSEVWLDLSRIEIVNSAELSALIRFALRMRQLDKSVFLCEVGANLQEIFEITRFDTLVS